MISFDMEQVYTQYRSKVLGYITARVQRRSDAEDLCEDVFEKVFRKIGEYQEDRAALNTWIFTITRNTVIDHYRRMRPFGELDETIPAEGTVDAPLLKGEMLENLAEALKMLPQEQRDIVVLLYYDRKPMTEIAQMMHLSYGAVKLRHQKALSMLKRFLGA